MSSIAAKLGRLLKPYLFTGSTFVCSGDSEDRSRGLYEQIPGAVCHFFSPTFNSCLNGRSLDDYCVEADLTRIHLLQLGMRDDPLVVLRGATKFLRRGKIDFILFDQGSSRNLLKECAPFLKSSRYALAQLSSDQLIGCAEDVLARDESLESPLIAINERFQSALLKIESEADIWPTCRKRGIVPRGVVLVGAHEGTEVATYGREKVPRALFIEANPAVFQRMQARVTAQRDVDSIAVNCAITDQDGPVTLRITSMDQSSSILPLKRHREIAPDIIETSQIVVEGRTLDHLFKELGELGYTAPMEDYNLMFLDIQGAELKALHGASELLKCVDAITTEVNYTELYSGCALIDALDDFLESKGFERVAAVSAHGPTWGDALYLRRSL